MTQEARERITLDEVKDALIDDFCRTHCKEEAEDYHCPDHACLVWKFLSPPKLELIGDDIAEKAVRDWVNVNFPVRSARLDRGHWEDVIPVIAKAQKDADWKAIGGTK